MKRMKSQHFALALKPALDLALQDIVKFAKIGEALEHVRDFYNCKKHF